MNCKKCKFRHRNITHGEFECNKIDDDPNNGTYINCHDSYKLAFIVADDFGCNKFEEKYERMDSSGNG